jgi:serine/threonine-protein kinase
MAGTQDPDATRPPAAAADAPTRPAEGAAAEGLATEGSATGGSATVSLFGATAVPAVAAASVPATPSPMHAEAAQTSQTSQTTETTQTAETAASPASSWRLDGFEELRELGRGGFGHVVAARHAASGALVAIKYLSPALAGDPQFRAAFRAEAAILRGLDSPWITRFFDYVEEPTAPGAPHGGGAAIVMELVPGVSLRALLKRGEPLPPESALVLLKGSLLGLAAAHHSGLVHRDYKPENVLVLREGASKLSDFGIAVRTGDHTAASVGTAAYLAPELWRGEPPTPRCDIYAATVTFFECVTGHRPYQGTDPALLGPAHLQAAIPVEAAPPQVRSLLLRGLAKEPAQRPDHALSFLAELEATAAQAYGPGWEERGRQRLAILAAAGVAALGLAAIPALSVLFGGGAIAGGAGGAAGGAAGVVGAGLGGTAAQGAAQGVAQGVGRGLGVGRRLLRARHLLKLGTTGGKVVAAVAATAVVAGGVAVGVHEVDKPKPAPAPTGTAQSGGGGGGAGGAGTAWSVGYRTASQSIPVPGNPSYPDVIATQTPVITGMTNPALQARVNAVLAKPIQDGVAANRKALASSSASNNAEVGFGYSDTVTATTAGKLLYVRYTHNVDDGFGDGAWISAQTVLFRTDTWQQLDQSQLIAPSAKNASASAANTLAGVLSANLVFDGVGCVTTPDEVLYQNMDGTPITSGEQAFDSTHPAMLEIDTAVLGVTPRGYEFRYSAGVGLLSHACESGSALIPFSALSGIADPSIVALAQAHGTVHVSPPAPQLTQTYSGKKYLDIDPVRAALADSGGFRAAGSLCALVGEDTSGDGSASGPNCYQLTMDVDAAADLHAHWTDPSGTEFDEYQVGGTWYLSSNDPEAAFPGLSADELGALGPGRYFAATPAELNEIATQGGDATFTDDFSLLTVSELLQLMDPGGSATVQGATAQGARTVIDCSAEQDPSAAETLTVTTATGAPQSVADPQQNAELQFSGYGAVPAITAPATSSASS